jgi:hypothetical protein
MATNPTPIGPTEPTNDENWYQVFNAQELANRQVAASAPPADLPPIPPHEQNWWRILCAAQATAPADTAGSSAQ